MSEPGPLKWFAFLSRLDRFEKTNEMLLNFNNLSCVRMQQMNERFLHHTRTLVEMKKDLDSIFRRIRWAGRLHFDFRARWGLRLRRALFVPL